MGASPYSTDLTDAEWSLIEPLLPGATPGSPPDPDLRLVINGIFFLMRSGCDLRTSPPWSTAERYYERWRGDGTWEKVMAARQDVRPAVT